MKRVALVTACLAAGLVAGLGGALALGSGEESVGPDGSAVLLEPAGTTAPEATTSVPSPTTVAPTPPPPRRGVLMAWTAGGLPAGFAPSVRDLPAVEALTVVRGELLHLVHTADRRGRTVEQVPEGWVVPLDVLAVDPARFVPFVRGRGARAALQGLGPDEAVLGRTSAALRGVGVGGRLRLASGPPLTVTGVVADRWVAGAEVVVNRATGAAIGVTTDRYLLLRHRGARAALDGAMRSMAGEAVRTRAPGETPFLRHADAVLPQALIKERFGEFAYRPTGTGSLTLAPGWVDEHIVDADLPVLGRLTCHRALLPALRGALEELVAANLGHLVASFEGCWNPRTIAGSTQISRHAWGAAVDVNFSVNPTGRSTVQDPRLVAVFERWGFGSGDLWLVPDSGHFEYVARPG